MSLEAAEQDIFNFLKDHLTIRFHENPRLPFSNHIDIQVGLYLTDPSTLEPVCLSEESLEIDISNVL